MTCVALSVLHPRSKLVAKILDRNGVPVPEAEYDLDVDGEDFTFKFKKPYRGRSGRYTLSFANDAGETRKDIYVNFQGGVIFLYNFPEIFRSDYVR